jgi:hypothetical protein
MTTTNQIDCGICYTTPGKQTFVDCGECTNKVCTECFSRLRNLKCPYCRHKYHNGNFEQPEDELPPLQIPILLERQNGHINDTPIPAHAVINEHGELEILSELSNDSENEYASNYEAEEEDNNEEEDDIYELTARYFTNPLNGTPDVVQHFRQDIHERFRQSVRSLAYDSVKQYFNNEISIDNLLDILVDAKQIHNQ